MTIASIIAAIGMFLSYLLPFVVYVIVLVALVLLGLVMVMMVWYFLSPEHDSHGG